MVFTGCAASVTRLLVGKREQEGRGKIEARERQYRGKREEASKGEGSARGRRESNLMQCITFICGELATAKYIVAHGACRLKNMFYLSCAALCIS